MHTQNPSVSISVHLCSFSNKKIFSEKLERYYQIPATDNAFEKPGKLIKSQSTKRGAFFYFEKAESREAEFFMINILNF
ncbi:hypothetical protein CEN39_02785 [Fischerella thermalis CCMEE 5201]|jgi:hypothetical protein|nr:hypothetical protein CEN39_02785 [Fischerella thermalis CCMEE 5201]